MHWICGLAHYNPLRIASVQAYSAPSLSLPSPRYWSVLKCVGVSTPIFIAFGWFRLTIIIRARRPVQMEATPTNSYTVRKQHREKNSKWNNISECPLPLRSLKWGVNTEQKKKKKYRIATTNRNVYYTKSFVQFCCWMAVATAVDPTKVFFFILGWLYLYYPYLCVCGPPLMGHTSCLHSMRYIRWNYISAKHEVG